MEENKQTIESRIDTLHFIIKDMFPEAVGVNVFVSSEGITVNPEYRSNISGCSMKTITGNWIKKV